MLLGTNQGSPRMTSGGSISIRSSDVLLAFRDDGKRAGGSLLFALTYPAVVEIGHDFVDVPLQPAAEFWIVACSKA